MIVDVIRIFNLLLSYVAIIKSYFLKNGCSILVFLRGLVTKEEYWKVRESGLKSLAGLITTLATDAILQTTDENL